MALDGDSESWWVSGGCLVRWWAGVCPGDKGMCSGGMHASVCLSTVFIQAQQALVDARRLLPAKTPPSPPGRSRHVQAEGLCITCSGGMFPALLSHGCHS